MNASDKRPQCKRNDSIKSCIVNVFVFGGRGSAGDRTGYLEDGAVEEESEQLDEVEEDVAVLLLHADDVGHGEGPVGVDAAVRGRGPGEEAELEEVLHYHRQLRHTGGGQESGHDAVFQKYLIIKMQQ